MPVPTLITDLSTSAGSNSPSGSETPIEGDNHLRAAYSFIAQLRDQQTTATNQLNGTATGVVLKSASTTTGFTIGSAAGDALTINSNTASVPNGLTFSNGGVSYTGSINYSVAASGLRTGVNGVGPAVTWVYSPGGADSKLWDFYVDATALHLRAINDANSTANDALKITRSGITVTQIDLNPTTLNYNGAEVGTRKVTSNIQTSNYTLVASDSAKNVRVNSPATQVTVPNGVFAGDEVVTIVNNTGGSITIVQGSGLSLRQSGTSNTGNRTLLVNGVCTVLFLTSGFANIQGAGLT